MNETNPEQQTMPARVVRWTQKLLDLSLRNRLLNVRDVKQVLPLACRDVARLEDQLASDEVVSIAFGDPTENFLVSGCTPDETKRRLKVLYRLAKSDLEESGVNTLFLAIGFLRWKAAPKDEKTYRAPLLLMPSSFAASTACRCRTSIRRRRTTTAWTCRRCWRRSARP